CRFPGARRTASRVLLVLRSMRREQGGCRDACISGRAARVGGQAKKGPPSMFLQGKTALVTGSTSGIGLAIARALAGEGAKLILNGFGDPAEIAKLQAELGAGYNGADLTRAEAIEEMMAEAGPVDILVNNAGTQHVAPVDQFPVDKWDLIIALNLSAAFHTTRLAVSGMRAKGWGRIVNTASAHSLVASLNKSAYV